MGRTAGGRNAVDTSARARRFPRRGSSPREAVPADAALRRLSGFHGWQVQPESAPCRASGAALGRLTARPAAVVAAGRTDRGRARDRAGGSAVVPGRWTPRDAAAGAERACCRRTYGWRRRRGAGCVPRPLRRGGARLHLPRGHGGGGGIAVPAPLVLAAAGGAGRRPAGGGGGGAGGGALVRAFAKAGQPERGERCTVCRAAWGGGEPGWGTRSTSRTDFCTTWCATWWAPWWRSARGRRPASDVGALLAGAPGLETSPAGTTRGTVPGRVYYSTSANSRGKRTEQMKIFLDSCGPERDPARG